MARGPGSPGRLPRSVVAVVMQTRPQGEQAEWPEKQEEGRSGGVGLTGGTVRGGLGSKWV